MAKINERERGKNITQSANKMGIKHNLQHADNYDIPTVSS